MEIKVKYKINDKVIQRGSELELIVVWYNYIETSWLQYICIDTDWKLQYLNDIQIEQKQQEFTLWFIINEDIQKKVSDA